MGRAEEEIRNLKYGGLLFEYELTDNIINKFNIAINLDGFSIEEIVSNLMVGEKLIFAINKGVSIDSKYYGSIYNESELYGDFIRINSDKGSIREWIDNLIDKDHYDEDGE